MDQADLMSERVEGADLRTVMRSVASTVAVVTARGKREPLGITATSVASVSLDPPAILVCVNRSARLHRAIVEAASFRVNYLAWYHEEVARTFAVNLVSDRFAVGSWDLGAECGPRLRDALAQMTCTLEQTVDFGTHSIFIGAVGSVHVGSDEPLLYCRGAYVGVARSRDLP